MYQTNRKGEYKGGKKDKENKKGRRTLEEKERLTSELQYNYFEKYTNRLWVTPTTHSPEVQAALSLRTE